MNFLPKTNIFRRKSFYWGECLRVVSEKRVGVTVSTGKTIEALEVKGKGVLKLFVLKSDSPEIQLVLNVDGESESFPSISELRIAGATSQNDVVWVSSFTPENYSLTFRLEVPFFESLSLKVRNVGSLPASISTVAVVLMEE